MPWFLHSLLATLIGRKQNGGGEKELKMAALGASKVKCPPGEDSRNLKARGEKILNRI